MSDHPDVLQQLSDAIDLMPVQAEMRVLLERAWSEIATERMNSNTTSVPNLAIGSHTSEAMTLDRIMAGAAVLERDFMVEPYRSREMIRKALTAIFVRESGPWLVRPEVDQL